jgi:excisionase family DNA binding protein
MSIEPHPMPKKILNVKALAAMMGVSRHTVYVWCREEKIPYLRLGRGQIRFNPDEVMQAFRASGSRELAAIA